MEICVNEYVRTKNGYIARLKEKSENCWDFDNTIIDSYTETSLLFGEDNYYGYDQRENIIKHSKNIIDLIEVGDYVNGKLIHKVDIRENSAYIYYGNCKTFTDYQIKSVVTKEQFKNIEYIVEE